MPLQMIIKKLVPWSDLNEYEGQIEGLIDGYKLCCRVIMSGAQEWQEYSPGDIINADIYLVRCGDVTILDESTLPTLHQIADVSYEVKGIVTHVSGDIILLKSSLPFLLEVNLDISPHMKYSIPEIQVGNQIFVSGVMCMDLDPEEE
ncbi:MAG: hypothetical protein HC916_19420 [Coleofasciculaceae cyanobacterium SM2_1_6]|nr:hypothetical protein [Coleofasciculaceae cyanobacterium SM2_1_6]